MSGNERFWTVVLYVVTVSYAAFCCLILGWLLATERSWIGALVAFGATYGTLLAGIPVLIAVLVAKQQLDANRRQHRSNVKIETLDRLRAIAISKNKMQILSQWEIPDTVIVSMKEQGIRIFTPFDIRALEYISKFLPPPVFSTVNMVDKHFCGIPSMIENNNSVSIDTIKAALEIGRSLAKQVIVQLENEEQSILSLAE